MKAGKKILNEFKDFAVRGNVIDMAVGIIIGAAFTKVVNSLVSDVLMPPLGMLIGQVDFSHLAIHLKEKTAEFPAVVIQYGKFINTILDFTIVAFAVFILIKQVNRFVKSKDPTTKKCPFCISTIPIKATKCPSCTSDL